MIVYILIGLVCGFVDSALGMGFGVTCTTILVTFGITPAVVGASILSWLSLAVAKPIVRVVLILMGFIVFYRHAFKYEINGNLSDNKAIFLQLGSLTPLGAVVGDQ